jgi:hypothetical protein
MVMRSFIGTGFFTDQTRYVAQRRYALSFFDLTGNPALDALRWWVEWNSLGLPYADVVVQLESFGEEEFAGILERIPGVPNPASTAATAFAAMTGPVNTAADRGHRTGDASLTDLDDGPTLSRAVELARSLGYSL